MANINKIFTEASFFDIDPAKLKKTCGDIPLRHFRPIFIKKKSTEEYSCGKEKARKNAGDRLGKIARDYLIFTDVKINYDGCDAQAVGVGWTHDDLAVFAADNTSFESPNQYLERQPPFPRPPVWPSAPLTASTPKANS